MFAACEKGVLVERPVPTSAESQAVAISVGRFCAKQHKVEEGGSGWFGYRVES